MLLGYNFRCEAETMMSNLRESPRRASSGPVDGFPSRVWHLTRWQAIRAGMWKGAKLGFLICSSLIFGAFAAGGIAMSFVPQIHRAAVLEYGPIGPLLIAKGIACAVFMSIAFGILYGAIPGALIGGTLAGVRWRRSDQVAAP
jgi:hypothetical protein